MTVFGTVVYPSALQYLDEFVVSLNNQTIHNFDLLIINDNIDRAALENCLSAYHGNRTVIDCCEKKSPADLRVDMIKEAKLRNYELLIIGDVDDLFDKDRIKEVSSYYSQNKQFDFYYNSLVLFDGKPALKEFPAFTTSIYQILECNYLGLSNTSINLALLSLEFIDSLYGCNSFVFDWYFYSRILINNGKGAYVSNALTFYRIYANNFAGVSREKQLAKELEVKKKHYELMRKYSLIFDELLQKILMVKVSTIVPDDSLSYWWNNIKLLEE